MTVQSRTAAALALPDQRFDAFRTKSLSELAKAFDPLSSSHNWTGTYVDVFSPNYDTAERQPWDVVHTNSRRYIDLHKDTKELHLSADFADGTWWGSRFQENDSKDTTATPIVLEPHSTATKGSKNNSQSDQCVVDFAPLIPPDNVKFEDATQHGAMRFLVTLGTAFGQQCLRFSHPFLGQGGTLANIEIPPGEVGNFWVKVDDDNEDDGGSIQKLTNETTKENDNGVGVVRTFERAHICMRKACQPQIRMVEHGLPHAEQTHEMLVDTQSRSLLATQLLEGRLVKLHFDNHGEITCGVDYVHMGLSSAAAADAAAPDHVTEDETHHSSTSAHADDDVEHEEAPFVGMHGLGRSHLFPGRVWVTLQLINKVCLVNIDTLEVETTIVCPRNDAQGEILGGPHCAVEGQNHKLYICMKGGATCHGSVASTDIAEEATTHGIFRVDLNPPTGFAVAGTGIVFSVPPTPVMCVLDEDFGCWVATDASPFVSYIPCNASSPTDAIQIPVPFNYAIEHMTGPGIQLGPDGNPWFVILKAKGVLGKIDRKTHKVTMFQLLTSDFNSTPRLCHLSWDFKADILYAISSDLLDPKAVNTLFRIRFDPKYTQIIGQHELALPSQSSAIHRIAHIDEGVEEPSVLVTELTKSQVLQLFKSTLPPLTHVKTMEFTVRQVYDDSVISRCPKTPHEDTACLCAMTESDRERQAAGEHVEDIYSLPRRGPNSGGGDDDQERIAETGPLPTCPVCDRRPSVLLPSGGAVAPHLFTDKKKKKKHHHHKGHKKEKKDGSSTKHSEKKDGSSKHSHKSSSSSGHRRHKHHESSS